MCIWTKFNIWTSHSGDFIKVLSPFQRSWENKIIHVIIFKIIRLIHIFLFLFDKNDLYISKDVLALIFSLKYHFILVLLLASRKFMVLSWFKLIFSFSLLPVKYYYTQPFSREICSVFLHSSLQHWRGKGVPLTWWVFFLENIQSTIKNAIKVFQDQVALL